MMSQNVTLFELNQPLLSPEETAKLLGISPGTLMVWRSTGRYRLPFVKCGRKVMYRQSDIQTFIEERTYLHTD